MKTWKILGTLLVLCLASTLVIAEDSDKKETQSVKKKVRSIAPDQPKAAGVKPPSGRRAGSANNRQAAFQQRLAMRSDSHKKAVAELEAIKKIAEEEGATRTVEALQKMIDKKNDEFKKATERFERQRRERSEQLQQRSENAAENKSSDAKK